MDEHMSYGLKSWRGWRLGEFASIAVDVYALV